jgi:hypothetical protein
MNKEIVSRHQNITVSTSALKNYGKIVVSDRALFGYVGKKVSIALTVTEVE